MNTPYILGIVAGFFLISGYVPYIKEVLSGSTKPNRASWIIWSLSTTVILVGVKETGTNEAIWVPVADAVGCFVIFLLAIWKGTGGWSMTDRIAFAICLVSLVIWWTTGNALIALITNLCIYVSGYIPTIKKSIRQPKTESLTAWTFFFIGVLLNLLTVVVGTDTGFAIWLYPIVLVATVGTLYYFLIRNRV